MVPYCTLFQVPISCGTNYSGAKMLLTFKCSGTKICVNQIWGTNYMQAIYIYIISYIDWFTLVHTGSHWFNSSFLLFFMYIYLYIVLLYPIVRYFDRYRMIRGWSAPR